MKSSKKKLLLTSALISACGCFALVACGTDTTPSEPVPFAAPENVNVSVNTLSWGEIAGATNGYTVRINTDESTVVNKTSLDLTTVTAKLATGSNTLSVKVNATDEYLESAYSQTVTYTYTPSKPGKTPFATLTIKLEGATISWTAVDGATNGYTVKSGTGEITVNENSIDLESDKAAAILKVGDNNISVKVNAAGNHNDSAYSNTVAYKYEVPPEIEAQGFVTAVNTIGDVTANSLTAIETAKSKYENLTDGAKAVDVAATAYATLKAKDCAYYALLVNAIATVDADSTLAELNGAETTLSAAAAYYKDKLIDKDGATDAKTLFEEKLDAHTTVIADHKAAVNNIADAIDLLVAKEYDETLPTKADYDALVEKEEAIAALTEYQAKYWEDTYSDKSTAITNKKTEICAIPVETKKADEYYGFGANGNLNIVREYINIMGERCQLKTAPTVTYTLNGGDEQEGAFTYKKGSYVYQIPYNPESINEFVYTVSGEEQQTEKFEVFLANAYVSAGGGKAFDANDVLKVSQLNGAKHYFDVFLSSDITTSSSGIEITGTPVARGIEFSDGITKQAVLRHIARSKPYGDKIIADTSEEKPYTVRLVFYSETVTKDNTTGEVISTARSCINDASVSEAFTFNLTEDDKFEKLTTYFATTQNRWTIDGNAVVEGSSDNEIWYPSEITQYCDGHEKGIALYFFDVDGIDDIQTHKFAPADAFAKIEWTNTTQGWLWKNAYGGNDIYSHLEDAWKQLDAEGRKKTSYTFALALQVLASDDAKEEGYADSDLVFGTYKKAENGHTITERAVKEINIDYSIPSGVLANNMQGDPFWLYKTDGDTAGLVNRVNGFSELNETITAQNIGNYLQVRVRIYDVTDDTLLYSTTTALGGANGDLTDGSGQGKYKLSELLNEWMLWHFYKQQESGEEVTKNIKVTFALEFKHDALKDIVGSEIRVTDVANLPESGLEVNLLKSKCAIPSGVLANNMQGDPFYLYKTDGDTAGLVTYANNFAAELGETVTAQNIGQYMHVRVRIYDVNDDTLLYSTTTALGGANGDLTDGSGQGKYKLSELLDEWKRSYFFKDNGEDTTYTIKVTLSVEFMDEALKNVVGKEVRVIDGGTLPETGLEVTLSKSDYTAANDNQFGFAQTGWLGFLKVPGHINGDVFAKEGVEYIIVEATNDEETVTMYFLKNDENLYLSTSATPETFVEATRNPTADVTHDTLWCNTVVDGNSEVTPFNTWVKNNYGDIVGDNFDCDTWKFRTKIIADGEKLFDGDWSDYCSRTAD